MFRNVEVNVIKISLLSIFGFYDFLTHPHCQQTSHSLILESKASRQSDQRTLKECSPSSSMSFPFSDACVGKNWHRFSTLRSLFLTTAAVAAATSAERPTFGALLLGYSILMNSAS